MKRNGMKKNELWAELCTLKPQFLINFLQLVTNHEQKLQNVPPRQSNLSSKKRRGNQTTPSDFLTTIYLPKPNFSL